MNEDELREAVAENERELRRLDGELERLRSGGRFDRAHLMVALSLLLLLFAGVARTWMHRAQPPTLTGCDGR